MRHFKLGIPILGSILLATTGLYGCADESPWESSSDQKGSISLTLSTESSIKTAKPTFRSGDDDSAANPNDLNTYIKVPTPEQFSIKLEKSDESFSKTWTSLQGFLNYTKENFFTTGAYTLTAYYGEKGKQDFEAPYFEASSTFNVLSDEVYYLDLVAELKNSMVKVNYSDNFKEYMKDYHSRIRTEGKSEEIIYTKEQTAPVFIEPNNAALTVHFTTKGKSFTSAVKIGEFPPLAKTLHNITLDIAEKDNGYAQLEVKFDDSLEEENVYIDLTEELLTSGAPIITCTGFTNGSTVDMLEGSVSDGDIKMIVNAAGGIKSAIMTVESNTYRPTWGSQIDLCKATDAQISDIEAAGIEAIGFGFRGLPSESLASLNLSKLGKSLPIGRHTISLQVTDNNDGVSDVTSVILDSQPIAVDVIGAPQMTYGAKKATVAVSYNGADPLSELKFQSDSDMGNWVDLKVLSCEEETATRTIESKNYIFELQLPENVNTARESLKLKIFQNGSEKASGEIKINVPAYRLEYDAFTDHAFVKVITPDSNDPNVISTMIEKFQLKLDGADRTSGILRESEIGYIAILNLEPGKQYAVTSCITKGETWNDNGTFSTESELSIPNGDFKGHGEKWEMSGLQVGGQYRVSPTDYTLKSSFSYTQPADWANVNTNTAWKDASNKNTWFIVPSTWLDTTNEVAVMRSVGYHHNGTTPAKSGGAFNTTYYCENAPSSDQLEKAAGELFLGEYNFNGNEDRKEGIAFASRPSAISFDYKYELKNDQADRGAAVIKILAADGTLLGSDEIALEPSSTMKTVSKSFDYGMFGKKAAKLIVSFKSSNQTTPPIHIPTGAALNEGQTLGNHTLNANSYHALATGSVLTIDNVKAIYGNIQNAAKTPKRTTKKNR